MKSEIAYCKEDEDLLLVTMIFTFEALKGPELRKRLAVLGYKIYPMDKVRLTVSSAVFQVGQGNTSIHNTFTIQRHYEIAEGFEAHVDEAKEHAERYFQRVIAGLKDIHEVIGQSWR